MINDERCKKGEIFVLLLHGEIILEVSSTPLMKDTQGFNSGVDALEGAADSKRWKICACACIWTTSYMLGYIDFIREIRVYVGCTRILCPIGSIATLSLCSISISIDLSILPKITTTLEYFYHPLD